MKTQKISRRVAQRMTPPNRSPQTRCPVTNIFILIFFSACLVISCGDNTSKQAPVSSGGTIDETPAPATPAPATPAPAAPAPEAPATTTPVPDGGAIGETPAPAAPAPVTPIPDEGAIGETPAPATTAPAAPAPEAPTQSGGVIGEAIGGITPPQTPEPEVLVPETPAPDEGTTGNTVKYTLSGIITGGNSAEGIAVTITATDYSTTTTTDVDGKYSFGDLSASTYTVTPTKGEMVFKPANLVLTDLAANKTDANFAAADIQNTVIVSVLAPDTTLSRCSDDETTIFADNSAFVGVQTTSREDCFGLPKIFRTYLKFSLADIDADSIIQSATLSFYQDKSGSVYSEPAGDLTIDHVDFGETLDDATVADWSSAANGSIINTSNSELVSIDVRTYVASDITADIGYSEYRLSFPDTIAAGDYIRVYQGGERPPPTLAVTYYKF